MTILRTRLVASNFRRNSGLVKGPSSKFRNDQKSSEASIFCHYIYSMAIPYSIQNEYQAQRRHGCFRPRFHGCLGVTGVTGVTDVSLSRGRCQRPQCEQILLPIPANSFSREFSPSAPLSQRPHHRTVPKLLAVRGSNSAATLAVESDHSNFSRDIISTVP